MLYTERAHFYHRYKVIFSSCSTNFLKSWYTYRVLLTTSILLYTEEIYFGALHADKRHY